MPDSTTPARQREIAERVLLVEASQKSMADQIAQIGIQMSHLVTLMENKEDKGVEAKRWAIGISVSTFLVIIGGVFAMGDRFIRGNVDQYAIPMRADVSRMEGLVLRNGTDLTQLSAASVNLMTMATRSEQDRADLRRDVSKLLDSVANESSTRRAQTSSLSRDFTETETQHRMQDQARNLQYDHLHSLIEMLYENAKLPKPAHPVYFPSIGRMSTTPLPTE